jgi:hypothetical protein
MMSSFVWSNDEWELAALFILALDVGTGQDPTKMSVGIAHPSGRSTYTFDLMILSPVVWKTKFVSKIYRKVLISIMENRMPIHDWVAL